MKVHSISSIYCFPGRLEEKGLLFHCACTLPRAAHAECTEGTTRSVTKLWELKVIHVLLYVPQLFYRLLFIQESSTYYFLKIPSARKTRTKSNFEIFCSKIYTALQLQIFLFNIYFSYAPLLFLIFQEIKCKRE